MSSHEAATRAATTLDRAFATRDTWSNNADVPRIGIFGNGVPETLIGASGALPVHLSLGMTNASHPIESVIEPFVDEEVRGFLVRLMEGEFSAYRGIVFARDDAPALIAYQYASEWIRQENEAKGTPPLFLWNLVHTDSAAVAAFNAVQAGKLFDFLAAAGLKRPSADDIALAADAETGRQAALKRLKAAVPEYVSGTAAAAWRNAGRFMPAGEHARLLDDALSGGSSRTPGRRIGLVGSPLACPNAYRMLETFGTVVCDQQGFGETWPAPGNGKSGLTELLAATAADPSCPRVTPAGVHRAHLLDQLQAARCDLVICQLSQTDDTFGWEIPALAQTLGKAGVTFINLGFRDARPDEAWLNGSAARISQALEAGQ
jgi:hypothetical protein